MEAPVKSLVGCNQLTYRWQCTLDIVPSFLPYLTLVHGHTVTCKRFCFAVYSMFDYASGLSVPPTRYSISLFDVRSAESLYQGPASTRADLLTRTFSSNQTTGTWTVASARHGPTFIFYKSAEEHLTHIIQVLNILRTQKFYTRLYKCHFHQISIKYLGHIISADGIQVNPKKIQVVKDWPRPKGVCQI